MPNYLNNPNVTKGVRNNNPANLRRLPYKNGSPQYWQGEVPYSQSADPEFSQFYDMKHGIRAMMKNIITNYNRGVDTISELINKFSPPNENNTVAYIQSVVNDLHISEHTVIDLTQENLISLCKSIVFVETYPDQNKVTDQDYKDAIAILGVTLKKKATPAQGL